MAVKNSTVKKRALYGNTTPSDVYQIRADIDTPFVSTEVHIGSLLSDCPPRGINEVEDRSLEFSPTNEGPKLAVEETTPFSDVSGSYNANQDSVCGDTRSKSTTYFEEKNSTNFEPRKTRRSSQTLYPIVDKEEPKMPHKYSAWADPTDPYALQQWLEKPERHERIACQREQPFGVTILESTLLDSTLFDNTIADSTVVEGSKHAQ